MSLDYTKLVAQGRAKAFGIPWSEEELAALITLESECHLTRTNAADYVRAGVLTPEAYEETKKNGLVPEKLEDIQNRLVQPGQLVPEASSEESKDEPEEVKKSKKSKK